MLQNGGEFVWSDETLAGGIQQDVSASTLRYRIVRNLNQSTRGAQTKDMGVRSLMTIALTSYSTFGGYDFRWQSSGTTYQKLLIFQDNGSTTSVYVFDPTTRTAAAEATTLARVKPCTLTFANKLITIDGTTIRSWTGSAWATPGTVDMNRCRFGVVYANRLILFGDPSYPYYFYPSGVRNETDWDANLAYEVLSARGEKITGAGTCGSYLLVGGNEFLRAFTLGTASPTDWDYDSLSEQSGPVNWQSFVEVTRPRGNSTNSFTFFWTRQGPAMVVRQGEGTPSLVPLHDSLREMMLGNTYQGLLGLNQSRFDYVEGVYVPSYNEVRFAVSSVDSSVNDMLLCLNVDSAIDYMSDPENNHPHWRVRDNDSWTFPLETIFTCEVDTAGLPSTTGTIKAFIAKAGMVYEMDALSSCLDNSLYPIKMQLRRDGYDGQDDGVREYTKSVRDVRIITTQWGVGHIYCRVKADGGSSSSESDVSLDEDLYLWTDSAVVGTWGDGTLWNAGETPQSVTTRIGVGCLGRRFDVEFYDNGEINMPIKINSFSLYGLVEGLY
jgi:hypothetical protein